MKRIITLLVPALLLSAPALAFDGPHGPPASPEERLDRALDHVDATDEQRTTLEELLTETLPKIKSLHEEGHLLREAMRDALTAEVVDRKEVEAIRRDAVDLFDRMSDTVLDAVVVGANVLTQEQRVTLSELHEAHHERMRARFQGRED